MVCYNGAGGTSRQEKNGVRGELKKLRKEKKGNQTWIKGKMEP